LRRETPGIITCSARQSRVFFRFAATKIQAAEAHFQFFVKFSRNMESSKPMDFTRRRLSAFLDAS
jgi:hypothetical protein